MAINASCPPKIMQVAPMATTIDLGTSRKVSGGVGDEESAAIDDRCDGCDRAVVSARYRRLWGRVGIVLATERAGEGAGSAPWAVQVGQTAK